MHCDPVEWVPEIPKADDDAVVELINRGKSLEDATRIVWLALCRRYNSDFDYMYPEGRKRSNFLRDYFYIPN